MQILRAQDKWAFDVRISPALAACPWPGNQSLWVEWRALRADGTIAYPTSGTNGQWHRFWTYPGGSSSSSCNNSNLGAAGGQHHEGASPTSSMPSDATNLQIRYTLRNGEIDGSGIVGGPYLVASTEASVPATPANLRVTTATDRSIALAWDDVLGETSYRLERRRGTSGDWNHVTNPNANATTYLDEGRSSSTLYEYRIRASNSQGDSAYSAPLQASTTAGGTEVVKGKLLSCNQAAALVYRAGWTSEAQGIEGTAIMRGESSFYTAAVSYTGCCFGLMQINLEVHEGSQADAFDPFWNVDKARDIYLAAGSWQPWQAYTGPDGAGSNGPWLNHVDSVEPCVQKAISDGGASADTIDGAPEVGSDYDPVRDPDSDTDLSCGFSVFCWIKAGLSWAFKPGDTTETAWESFHGTLQTRAPFSVAMGVGEQAGMFYDSVTHIVDNGSATEFCTTLQVDELDNPEACLGGPMADLAAAHPTLTDMVRTGFLVFLYLGTASVVWKVMRSGFSSSPDVKGGEPEWAEGSEKKDDDE